MPFPVDSKASVAVFEKKDELKLSPGWSLIKGKGDAFFLGCDNVLELASWNENGM
jgi:hypothetical protein